VSHNELHDLISKVAKSYKPIYLTCHDILCECESLFNSLYCVLKNGVRQENLH
jgi:hypothetical protein